MPYDVNRKHGIWVCISMVRAPYCRVRRWYAETTALSDRKRMFTLCYLRNDMAPENMAGRALRNPTLLVDSCFAVLMRWNTEPYEGGGASGASTESYERGAADPDTQSNQHKTPL